MADEQCAGRRGPGPRDHADALLATVPRCEITEPRQQSHQRDLEDEVVLVHLLHLLLLFLPPFHAHLSRDRICGDHGDEVFLNHLILFLSFLPLSNPPSYSLFHFIIIQTTAIEAATMPRSRLLHCRVAFAAEAALMPRPPFFLHHHHL